MASRRLLLRLSRDLARAARVSAARRRAELPVAPSSGSGGLASLPSFSRRRGVDARQPTTQGSSDAPAPCPGLSNSNLRTADYGSHNSPPGHNKRVVDLVIDQERLFSDKDMWHVYDSWCVVLRQPRDHDEKLRRFDKFKENIRRLASLNKSESGRYTLPLTPFDDGKLSEEA